MCKIGLTGRFGLALLLIPACLAACRPEQNAVDTDRRGFVAVVGIGQDDPLWPVLRASARRTYRELGISSPALRTVAPEMSSVNAQKKLLESLRRQGMVGLCVQVTEPEALAGALDRLARQGLAIVTMSRPVATQVSMVHAGFDDKAIGRALAEAIGEAIEDRGTIAVLHADSASSASAARRAAFLAHIATRREVRVILQFDCRANPDVAIQMLRETMQRYPRLSGWVVTGHWPLQGRPRGSELLPPGCRLVAVDPFPEFWPQMEGGRVWAMVASRYDQTARHAVTACVTELGGAERISTRFEAPVSIVGRTELDAFKQDWLRWTSENGKDDR